MLLRTRSKDILCLAKGVMPSGPAYCLRPPRNAEADGFATESRRQACTAAARVSLEALPCRTFGVAGFSRWLNRQ